MLTPGGAEITLLDLLSAVGGVVLGVWVGRYVPDIWRAGPVYQRTKLVFEAKFGEMQGAAFLATLPLVSAIFILGGVLALCLMVYDASTDPTLRSVMWSASYAIVPAFVILMLLFFSVLLFGRPRLLKPPRLRRESGVIPGFLRWSAQRLVAVAHDIRRR